MDGLQKDEFSFSTFNKSAQSSYDSNDANDNRNNCYNGINSSRVNEVVKWIHTFVMVVLLSIQIRLLF